LEIAPAKPAYNTCQFFLQEELSMRFAVSLLAGTVFFFFPLALHTAQTPASSDVDTLRALETAMMTAAAEKGAAGYISFYADDAVELPDGAPALYGKNEISNAMQFLNDKNNRLSWTPVAVSVSESRDLAYTYGLFLLRSIGRDGKPNFQHGKYTTIWKKQKDGQWKVILDMGNSSPTPKGRALG
jgi:ketosteroid isomerase-like protein